MPSIYKIIYKPKLNTNDKQFYIGSDWNDNPKYLGSPSDEFYINETKNNPQLFDKIILEKFNYNEITKQELRMLEQKYLIENDVKNSDLYFNRWDRCPCPSDDVMKIARRYGIETQRKKKVGIFKEDRNTFFMDDFRRGGINCSIMRKELGLDQWSLSKEDRIKNGKKSSETHKNNKTNFYNSDWQKKMSTRGASKAGKIGGKMIHVYNDNNKTRISPDKIDQFLIDNPDYKKGCPMDKSNYPRKFWVSNEKETIRINEDKLDLYLSIGYIRGRKLII